MVNDYEKARRQAAFFEYPDRDVLRVTGRDRASWLHKLFTSSVQDLRPGQGRRAALLEAKGHLVAPVTVLARAQELLLLAEPEQHAVLFNALRRYLFREKAQLTDASAEFSGLALIGPDTLQLIEQLFGVAPPVGEWNASEAAFQGEPVLVVRSTAFPVSAFDVWAAPAVRAALASNLEAYLPRLSPETVEVLRVEAGFPRWGGDIDGGTLALEAPFGFDVRVDQGCYVGQEVVARIVHRGHVNRKLLGLRFTPEEDTQVMPPARGGTIYAAVGEQPQAVGEITSAVRSPTFGLIGLGYVRREIAEAAQPAWVRGEGIWRTEFVEVPFEDGERSDAVPDRV